MTLVHTQKTKMLLLCLLAASLVMVSCSPSAAPLPTPQPATPAATELMSAASPTPQPSPTSLPGKVVLVTGPGAVDPSVQAALAELSSAAGLTLETRPSLQKEDLTPEMGMVVSLDASLNAAELAAAAPQTQFIAVSGADVPGAANLTVIRRRPEQQAFIAGFISVLLSTDYRAGGLIPADGPLGAGLQDAFENGAQYYCGVCAPGYPLVYYPLVAALPAASDGSGWQAAAAGMYDTQKVEVYYLSAEAARPEVFAYLQGRAQPERPDKLVLIVGEQTPPEELKGQWAATVRFDLASGLRQAWPDVLAGKGGKVLDAPLMVENPGEGSSGESLLGEGRLRLVNDLMNELKAGTVFPFTVPRE